MAKPIVSIQSVEQQELHVEPGTIMEHNEPPSMLVLVTEVSKTGGTDFNGICLNDGLYIGTGPMNQSGWSGDEFHIFRGSVTLSQGV